MMILKEKLNEKLFYNCVVIVIYITCVKSADILDLFTNRLQNGARSSDLTDEFQIVKYTTNDTPVIQLIRSYNYPAETHEVITEDGYILNIHRIPKQGKPILLLCHGLLGTSAFFLFQGPKKDLALLLSDEDYDIWLMNVRGSSYSRKHVYLDPDQDKEFWDYSFHEMGYYDLPATIDYILNTTNQNSIIYVGHSMGCATYFVMTTTRPEYNNKIKLMHALSPGVFIIHQPSPLVKLLLNNWLALKKLFRDQNIYEIMPLKNGTTEIGRTFCNSNAPTQNLCYEILFLIIGEDYQQINRKLLSRMLQYVPGGTSVNTVQHFAQNIKTGSFRPLNYGKEKNKIRYKNEEIFDYNLKKSTSPVMLYYGGSDVLITEDDVAMLASRLPNVVDSYKIEVFNHLDFLIAADAKDLLYDKMIFITNKYRNL